MKYTPNDVAGVPIVDIEPERDYRGLFSCWFCADDFVERGLKSRVAQTNISFSYTRATSRGLHRRMPPYAEAKLVHRTRGTIADDAVDVRPESGTYGRHASGVGNWSGARL